MAPVKGGIEGEFEGRVYPFVIGLKSGPRQLHLCGKDTTWKEEGEWIVVNEPNGQGGFNTLRCLKDNLSFIATDFFLIERQSKE